MPDDATIIEGDAGFLGMASRLNPVQLPAGMCQLVENMRLDRGVAQTRKGALRVATGIALEDAELTVPFTLGVDKTISSLVFSAGTITATAPAHGYATGDKVNIRGAAQPEYNGDFTVTVTGANSFVYTPSGTPTASPATSLGLAVGNVVTFSNLPTPTNLSASANYLISATPSSTTFYISSSNGGHLSLLNTSITPGVSKVNSSTGASYTLASLVDGLITISGSALVANKGPQTKTSYSGGIFATGVYSSPRFDQAKEYIVLCAPAEAYLWRVGETLRSISYPLTDTFLPGDDITVLQAFDKLYLHRDRPATLYRAVSVTVSGTTATATVNGHGYATNEVVRISNTNVAGLNADHTITVTGANTFTFSVPSGTASASGTDPIFARRVLPTLVWDGNIAAPSFSRVATGVHPVGASFSRMPAGPIVSYFNNQTAIVRGRDEVLISDVLDAETYDPVLKSFRANIGSNDELVAIHPYAEGQALVFGRKSIYLASIAIGSDGVSIDPAASSLQLLTNEIGCLARRTVATAGVFVFFLSESGVYRLDNQFDLKLRGNTQPLSDPVADLLEGINEAAADTSVGLFFNNRYYLAVPLGAATTPTAIFSYNMLNQQWEYRDTFGFEVGNLVVSDYSGRRRLFVANRNGGIFLLDEVENGEDDTQSGAGSDYQGGTLLTRRYAWGSLNAKRLLRVKSSLLLPDASALAIDAVTTDYDADFQVATLANTSGSPEDYTLKAPLRTKATYLDLRLRTLAGRPVIRQISAEATRSAFDPTETRTLN